MSTPTFHFGSPRNRSQTGLSLIETMIDAKARAEQQFLAEMRRKVTGMPFLEASLQFAELVSRQQRDFGHSLVQGIERVMSSRGAPSEPPPKGTSSQETSMPVGETFASSNETRPDPGQTIPVLRITVPEGTNTVVVPIQLRNHRQCVDNVCISAVVPMLRGILSLPVEFIQFDPEMLAIPAQSESSTQMLLRLNSDLAPGLTYWSEIVIAGAETKRIPISVQIRPQTRAGS